MSVCNTKKPESCDSKCVTISSPDEMLTFLFVYTCIKDKPLIHDTICYLFNALSQTSSSNSVTSSGNELVN